MDASTAERPVCGKCGLPIILVPSHSTEDCEIEGEMWVHDAESVPDRVDPCAAYDADEDHEAAARYVGGEPDTPAQHAKDWAEDWGFKPDEPAEPEVDLSSAFTDEMGKTL